NGIIMMDWPVFSPDANPIENVWSYLKMKLKGKRVFTFKQLCIKIKTIWRSLPEYAENLVKNMQKRCQAII
ncbi:Transposable element Tcb1 transposase, partial [Harpegnathos saltator]